MSLLQNDERKYEIMILLPEEFTQNELKPWVANCGNNLRKFSVSQISFIFRGKYNLAYSIEKKSKANYIQLEFLSMPKYLENVSKILKMDSNVLRFLVTKK